MSLIAFRNTILKELISTQCLFDCYETTTIDATKDIHSKKAATLPKKQDPAEIAFYKLASHGAFLSLNADINDHDTQGNHHYMLKTMVDLPEIGTQNPKIMALTAAMKSTVNAQVSLPKNIIVHVLTHGQKDINATRLLQQLTRYGYIKQDAAHSQ